MAKKIDPRLLELLKTYGEDNTSVWDCHGTWVAYHAAVERMAAKAGIMFDRPEMIVNDPDKRTVVVMVQATMGNRSDWSFGEVSPANNKNAYPYAMAEKRAKDRVALKLLGMAGLVYSEEEVDDFKTDKPTVSDGQEEPPKAPEPKKISAAEQKRQLEEIERDLLDCHTVAAVKKCAEIWHHIATRDGWSRDYRLAAKEKFDARRAVVTPDDEAFPGSDDTVSDIKNQFNGRVIDERITSHPINAG